MTDDQRTLESLKLLREASAWMFTVQTAIFGILVALLKEGKVPEGNFLIKGSVTAFGISIICAGVVLAAVPWVLNRNPVPASIQSAPIADLPLLKNISIGWTSGLQYLLFIVGLLFIASAVIAGKIG